MEANVGCTTIDNGECPGHKLVAYDIDSTHLVLSKRNPLFIVALDFHIVYD